MSDVEGIKKAVGTGYRKHISEYSNELISIPYNQKVLEKVTHFTDELIAVCPVTGLPDFYECTIEHVPGNLLVELKSLKFYLMSYRDVGILHEDLAAKIMRDIQAAIEPLWIQVTLEAAVRGGIGTKVVVNSGKYPLIE